MNKITPKQRTFILSLLEQKELAGYEAQVDLLVKCLMISEDPEEFSIGSQKASETITWLLARPNKVVAAGSAVTKLPPGRYAIENEQGELRFYQLWSSKDGKRHNLYVLFGPSQAKLFPKTQEAICQKILDAGYRECAIRFGNEIGACSNCGRQLTNRISRELGIGPICGGRMFGDSWGEELKAARDRVVALGEDPDEELTDEQWEMVKKLRVLSKKMNELSNSHD